MSGPSFAAYRRELLAYANGRTLEIGFGTGLNLAYYPNTVTQVTTVDPNRGMHKLAQKRVQSVPIPVETQVASGECLPFEADRFDTVVSTWTLCSIPDVSQALDEIHRVLKPGGRFLFIEHGLSDQPGIQAWQHRLTPFQKIIGDGCHLNRDMAYLIAQQFSSLDIKAFNAPNFPKVAGYFYQGIATKTLG